MGDLIHFTPEEICIRDQKWRMKLESQPGLWLSLICQLIKKGYQSYDSPLHPSIQGITMKGGHLILVVAKTGRLQIRIHYTLAQKLRSEKAWQIAQWLVNEMNELTKKHFKLHKKCPDE